MKDVKKCSLSGVAFTMDTDAYETIEAYLSTLRKTYGESADGEEIIADIEARIAELILSTHSSERVVEKPLIDNIIRMMGSAEDISSSSENEGASSKQKQSEPRIPRRLYRDTESAKLGGVCSGMARYFDIDPVWVRLVVMIPLLLTIFASVFPWAYILSPYAGNLFGMVMIAYIIMWFAVPAARTARQKLEMNGERITAQSIKDNTVVNNDADSAAKPVVANVVTLLGKVLLIVLKIFAALLVFCLVLAAFGLIIGIIAVMIQGYGELFNEAISALLATFCILSVLIPIIMLIYAIMCLVASRKPGHKTIITMFILWILSILATATIAIYEYEFGGLFKNDMQRGVVHRTEVVITGDTIDAERTIREFVGEDFDEVDIDIKFDKESARFSITERD